MMKQQNQPMKFFLFLLTMIQMNVLQLVEMIRKQNMGAENKHACVGQLCQ